MSDKLNIGLTPQRYAELVARIAELEAGVQHQVERREEEKLRAVQTEYAMDNLARKLTKEEVKVEELEAEHRYPHMCRDGHPEIGHATDAERCPACIERDAREKAEAALDSFLGLDGGRTVIELRAAMAERDEEMATIQWLAREAIAATWPVRPSDETIENEYQELIGDALHARAEEGSDHVRGYSHNCKGELHGDDSSVPYPNLAKE